MVCRNVDEHACIATYVQKRPAVWWAGDSLQRLQVPLKGQYSPLLFLNIKRILDRPVGVEEFLVFKAGVSVDQAALATLNDGVVPPISIVGASKWRPVFPDPLSLHGAGKAYEGIVGTTQIAGYSLHECACSFLLSDSSGWRQWFGLSGMAAEVEAVSSINWAMSRAIRMPPR